MQSQPLSRKELRDEVRNRRKVMIELLELQRKMVHEMRRNNDYPDELLRNKEIELDLEEARLRR